VIAIHNTHPIAKGQCPIETRVMENEPIEIAAS
jgi:hypothetical protein